MLNSTEITNRQRTLASILGQVGKKSPDDVIRFLDNLGDANLRNRVLNTMSGSYSNDEIANTLPFALALPESAERTSRLNWLLSAWAKLDPAAALAWMDGNNDPGVAFAATGVQTGILVNIAQEEPATAVAEWSRITDETVRKKALQPIAQEWAKTDPAAAVQWLFEQQQKHMSAYEGIYQFSNNRSLIYAWRKTDPEAALRWVEQTSLGLIASHKDFTLHSRPDPFAAIGGDWNETADRASTAQLLTKINDDKLRTTALTNHVRDWLKFDRKSATNWLEANSALTPQQAAALLAEDAKSTGGQPFDPFAN